MEIVKSAITYVFKEKGWENKLVPLYVALLAITFIGMFLNLVVQLPLEVANTYLRETGKAMPSLDALSSSFSSTGSILMLPVVWYIMGYLISVVRNISAKKETLLPEHNDLGNTFVKGLKLGITNLIATLPTTIIGSILFLFSLFGSITMFVHYGERGMYLGLGIVLVILTILLGVALAVVNSVITYSSWYIYYKENSFRKAINYKEIINVIRTHEKILLSILLNNIVIGFLQTVASMMAIILLCLSFFVFPVITLVGYFARAYIFADAYEKMSKLDSK